MNIEVKKREYTQVINKQKYLYMRNDSYIDYIGVCIT